MASINDVTYHLYNVLVDDTTYTVRLEHDTDWVSKRPKQTFGGKAMTNQEQAYKIMYNKKFMIIYEDGSVHIYALNYDQIYAKKNKEDISSVPGLRFKDDSLNDFYEHLRSEPISTFQSIIVKDNNKESVGKAIVQAHIDRLLLELRYASQISSRLIEEIENKTRISFVVTGDTHGELMSFAIWIELRKHYNAKGIHLGDVLDYKSDLWNAGLGAWDQTYMNTKGYTDLVWTAMVRIRDAVHIYYLKHYGSDLIICLGNHDHGLCTFNGSHKEYITPLSDLQCQVVLSVFVDFGAKQFLFQHGLIREEQNFKDSEQVVFNGVLYKTYWFEDNKLYLSPYVNSRNKNDELAYIFPSSVLNKDYKADATAYTNFFDDMTVNPRTLAEKLINAMKEAVGNPEREINPTIVFGHSYDYFALPFHALFAYEHDHKLFPQAGATDGSELLHQYEHDEEIRKKLAETGDQLSLYANVISMDDIYKYANGNDNYFTDKGIPSKNDLDQRWTALDPSKLPTNSNLSRMSLLDLYDIRDQAEKQIKEKEQMMSSKREKSKSRNIQGGMNPSWKMTVLTILLVAIIMVIVYTVTRDDIKPIHFRNAKEEPFEL